MTFLAQVTDPLRVLTMIAITVLTSGIGRARWPLIIAACVLVSIASEYMNHRDNPSQTLMITGFFAGMMIATITATVRAFLQKMKDDGKRG